MRKQVAAAALAAAFALPLCAGAQSAAPSKGQMMEAVVTVTSVDPASRTVRVQTPKGETVVSLSPEIKLENIQVGSRYRVRYSEPVAVEIVSGASPSASAGATAELKPKSKQEAGKAGEGVKMGSVAGTVEAIDPARRELVLRTPDGNRQAYKLPEGATLGPLKPGEPVTLTYIQAVATHVASTPQPISDPAPAP